MSRIVAHKHALGAVLHTGAGKGHHGNPVAAVKLDLTYGVPVLFSGLASLVLTRAEVDVIDQHVKITVENLLRLHPGTPRAVIAFLSGTLPGMAQLHIRQLSLFSMITRHPNNILNRHAKSSYTTSKPSEKSWFTRIRELCLTYNLPHPTLLLENPLPKSTFKTLVRGKVIDYWEAKLRDEAAALPSLNYFNPNYMSLAKPHPLLLTASSSPYEVIKATVQAKMLSGRYRTERLCRYWSQNTGGFCLVHTCKNLGISEDLPHILSNCPGLDKIRKTLTIFTTTKSSGLPSEVKEFVRLYTMSHHPLFVHFLLDCSQFPEVIASTQKYGPEILPKVFHITRTWCYSLHRERLKLLKKWRNF